MDKGINSSFVATRIEVLIGLLDHTPASFSRCLGHSNPTKIYHIIRGRNKPTLDIVLEIIKAFPKVSKTWLLTGEGSYLNTEYNEKNTD